MKTYSLAFLLLSIVMTSCSTEDDNDFTDINVTLQIDDEQLEETILNVAYGLHEQQVFDIYLPQGRSTADTKVLMVVHGGSWINGDKNSLTDFVLDLKEKNPHHAIVNINYVLGSENHYAFPNQFFDIQKAIDFIKFRKNAYHINPQFGLIGSSSGGQLALQYAYKHDSQDAVKFVGTISGPTNFLDPYFEENNAVTELIDLLVDKNYYDTGSNSDWTFVNEELDYLKLLSPVYEVSEESKPTILFYGNQDVVVPMSNGRTLHDTLKYHNISSSFNIFQGGHGGWNSESYKETMQIRLQEFIDTHLFVSDL
jgi:acetyl esterase/lipase